jgi:hypothetical protein
VEVAGSLLAAVRGSCLPSHVPSGWRHLRIGPSSSRRIGRWWSRSSHQPGLADDSHRAASQPVHRTVSPAILGVVPSLWITADTRVTRSTMQERQREVADHPASRFGCSRGCSCSAGCCPPSAGGVTTAGPVIGPWAGPAVGMVVAGRLAATCAGTAGEWLLPSGYPLAGQLRRVHVPAAPVPGLRHPN